jgi:predicted DNA-binding transcriptional regulator AlpA
MTNEILLSQRQVAELLGLSERTLEAMRLRGTGPAFVRISRRCVRYRLTDLESFIASRTVPMSDQRAEAA